MADKAKKPEPKKEGKKEEPPKEEPKKEEPKSEEPKKEEPKKDEEPKELILLTAHSEDGKLKAVLEDVPKDGKSRQFIKILSGPRILKTYDLSAHDVHGDVYTDATFGAFHFSPDNKKLLYVAEKKLPKCESFYKQKPKPKKPKSKDEEEESSRGTEYVYKPDWGEQLVGKHLSVVVILNTEDDSITPLTTIPDDCFPSQVLWAPNGEDIFGVAYTLNKIRLGLYACTNREACIFHLKGSEFNRITAKGLFNFHQ
ncbi:acylamino-acid-releasing enzyme-like, partial [Copidosoma floridanum]|uniref:acylamino-acid-releasing enzyme-like n=1 Tax=Copidosoma floridanum TaxID=29053 RepID=UPI000C6F60FA